MRSEAEIKKLITIMRVQPQYKIRLWQERIDYDIELLEWVLGDRESSTDSRMSALSEHDEK